MNKKYLLAAAVSGLMLASCSQTKSENMASPAVEKGECHDMNACKGQGDCGGDGHSCGGQNACKGNGWNKMSKADCDAKNGNFKKG